MCAKDDLKRIRGIGILIEKKLFSLGLTTFESIARLNAIQAYELEDILAVAHGRIVREEWPQQALEFANEGRDGRFRITL